MAIKTEYFNGVCKWAKVYKPDEKYGKYSIDVLLDMDQFTKLKALKVKNNGKPEDGKMWVTFRASSDAPSVTDASGASITDSIGNGSEVTIKLTVEDFVSQKWGNVVKSNLEAVRVDKLVVYVKPEVSTEEAQAPSTGRPRIAF